MTGRPLFQPTSLSAIALVVTLTLSVLAPASAVAAPEGQLTWAVHVSLAPTWFDPAETVGIVTPFMFLYALHDALVKPMPGNPLAPSLAESWSVSPDGLVYEFVLRKGVRFHPSTGIEGLRQAPSRRVWPPSTSSILTGFAFA